MKHIFFLIAITLCALVTQAQNHDFMLAPPDDAGEGEWEADYNTNTLSVHWSCYPAINSQGWNANGTTWMEICQRCDRTATHYNHDSSTGQSTFSHVEHSTMMLDNTCHFINKIYGYNPLSPTGIDVDEFDVLKKVMRETPAYASLRIPNGVALI